MAKDSDSSSGEESDAEDHKVSWVNCDACSKWRRLPEALAQALSDATPWCVGACGMSVAQTHMLQHHKPDHPEHMLCRLCGPQDLCLKPRPLLCKLRRASRAD
jgi:hypothetical protein